jgi:hypothetical protein
VPEINKGKETLNSENKKESEKYTLTTIIYNEISVPQIQCL